MDGMMEPARPAQFVQTNRSERFGEIVKALAKAQGMFISPQRNRLVRVKTKTGGSYDFRYATLDRIIDMTREPLSMNGIYVSVWERQRNGKTEAVVTLLHESEQWVEGSLPVIQSGSDAQSMGSALTYSWRYCLCALLNIASADDDDGGAASGNHVEDRQSYARHTEPARTRPPRDKVVEAVENRLKLRYDALIAACDRVKPHDGITGRFVLEAWQADMGEFSLFRHYDDGRRDAWNTILERVPAALKATFGEPIPEIWLKALHAETEADLQNLRAAWDSEWRTDLMALRTDNPIAWQLLSEHMRVQRERVMTAVSPAESTVSDEPPPEDPSDPGYGPPLSGPAEPPGGEPPLAAAAPQVAPQPVFPPYLLDASGEVAAEQFATARAFADAYVAMWTENSEDRLAIQEHNADGVADACEADPEVLEMVRALHPIGRTAEQLRVEELKGADGILMVAAYYQAVDQSLVNVRRWEIDAWEQANKPTYERLTNGAKLRVLSKLATRRKELGLEAKE